MLTYPISCADSLVVDPITLMRQQRGVPVPVVGPVITCTNTQINSLSLTYQLMYWFVN